MSERIHGQTYAAQGLKLPGGQKTLSPDMQAWITGLDVPDNDMGAKMVSPYMQSTWIYTAVSVMAENLAQIPFRISRIGSGGARRIRSLRGSSDPRHRQFCQRALGEGIIESGEVVDLFDNPHPTMDRTLFWEQVTSWDALRGEFFILALDESDGVVDLKDRAPRVRRMITLDTSMFWHIVTGHELQAWRYTGSPLMSPMPSEILAPSEVIHSRKVNPYLYWRGLSPLQVAMLPASADYAASMFMKGMLMNNADTGIIATTEQNLTPEQREQFTAALRERKRKAGTADRPLFLSSGVKIERPTVSNVDMQFLETRKFSCGEIASIYKVPMSVMGFGESKAGALSGGGNALHEDKLSFVEQNLAAKCHRYELAVDPIVKSFGDDLVGWFDIESLPIMQDARRTRVDTATKLFAMGVPFNDINQNYGLGFRDLPWGNQGFLPFNLQPADAMEQPEPAEDDPAQPDMPSRPAADDDDETPMAGMRRLLGGMQKAEGRRQNETRSPDTKLLWQRHMRARAAAVKMFQRKVGKVLNDFQGKVVAKLNEVHLEQVKAGGTKQRGLVDLIFSAADFGNALNLVLTHPIEAALAQAGAEAIQEVGSMDPWEMPPKEVAEFLAGRKQAIMGVGGTVREQLNTSLEEGYEAGETTAELAARVQDVFKDLRDGEAMRVARTETNLAFNAARHSAFADASVEYKAWLSSHGPRVRPGHADAEETYIDAPIPLDDPFIVDLDGEGEQMLYPGDDSLGASPGNIINCQCIQLAAQKTGEDAESETFNVLGLGVMRFGKAESRKQKAEVGHGCAK